MFPTCADVSYEPPAGHIGDSLLAHEAEKFPERTGYWLCEGTRTNPHDPVICRGRDGPVPSMRYRCRVCGFDRRHRFQNERFCLMGDLGAMR